MELEKYANTGRKAWVKRTVIINSVLLGGYFCQGKGTHLEHSGY